MEDKADSITDLTVNGLPLSEEDGKRVHAQVNEDLANGQIKRYSGIVAENR